MVVLPPNIRSPTAASKRYGKQSVSNSDKANNNRAPGHDWPWLRGEGMKGPARVRFRVQRFRTCTRQAADSRGRPRRKSLLLAILRSAGWAQNRPHPRPDIRVFCCVDALQQIPTGRGHCGARRAASQNTGSASRGERTANKRCWIWTLHLAERAPDPWRILDTGQQAADDPPIAAARPKNTGFVVANRTAFSIRTASGA